MRTRISSANQRSIVRWRLLIWDKCIWAGMAAWLLTSCISGGAQDSKSGEHAKTVAAQQNAPETKDGDTRIAGDATSAACKIKSDDASIATHAGEPTSPGKSEGRERMSKGSNESFSIETLTLKAPVRAELTDQIQLDTETATGEELQSKTVNSKPEPELKCTPREAATKTESAMPN